MGKFSVCVLAMLLPALIIAFTAVFYGYDTQECSLPVDERQIVSELAFRENMVCYTNNYLPQPADGFVWIHSGKPRCPNNYPIKGKQLVPAWGYRSLFAIRGCYTGVAPVPVLGATNITLKGPFLPLHPFALSKETAAREIHDVSLQRATVYFYDGRLMSEYEFRHARGYLPEFIIVTNSLALAVLVATTFIIALRHGDIQCCRYCPCKTEKDAKEANALEMTPGGYKIVDVRASEDNSANEPLISL